DQGPEHRHRQADRAPDRRPAPGSLAQPRQPGAEAPEDKRKPPQQHHRRDHGDDGVGLEHGGVYGAGGRRLRLHSVMIRKAPDPATIPADWLAEFEAAARRPLAQRMRYAFIRTYKPVLDDATYR